MSVEQPYRKIDEDVPKVTSFWGDIRGFMLETLKSIGKGLSLALYWPAYYISALFWGPIWVLWAIGEDARHPDRFVWRARPKAIAWSSRASTAVIASIVGPLLFGFGFVISDVRKYDIELHAKLEAERCEQHVSSEEALVCWTKWRDDYPDYAGTRATWPM